MTSNFLLLFSQLNLAFLSSEKRKKIRENCDFLEIEAIKIFEYKKDNDGY